MLAVARMLSPNGTNEIPHVNAIYRQESRRVLATLIPLLLSHFELAEEEALHELSPLPWNSGRAMASLPTPTPA